MWCRFEPCFGTFTMLLVEGSFETDFLEIYLTPSSKYVISEIQKLWGSYFISKCSKFNLDLENAAKNSEKVFCFWNNRIWIVVVKLSLLRAGYFSSVASVLTTSPNKWHVNRRDFFEHNFFASDQWICQKCCDTDFNSVCARLPCCLSKGSLKRYFLDIFLSKHVFRVPNFGNIQAVRVILFKKMFKILILKMQQKIEKKNCFSDSCIWIGIVKLSLLRTGYFSLVANVLANSPKIWHVNKRDIFQINCLPSDQWIW